MVVRRKIRNILNDIVLFKAYDDRDDRKSFINIERDSVSEWIGDCGG